MSGQKHLATFNLWRTHDRKLAVTVADAAGVKDELGGRAGNTLPLDTMARVAMLSAIRPEIQAAMRRLIEIINELDAERAHRSIYRKHGVDIQIGRCMMIDPPPVPAWVDEDWLFPSEDGDDG